MLRGIAEGSGDHFAFGVDDTTHIGASSAISTDAIAIDNGPSGPSAIIPDAHFLFTAQFARSGADLVLHDENSKTYIVHDYFASDERPRLLSPDGAALSGDVVAALAGPLAPGQYAQGAAATAPAHIEAVGRVAAAAGDATIVRNGVAIAAHAGDAVHKGDVLQTVSGEFGVTFNDGSTLNLTANSRLVVNEFVYSPNSANNSQLLNLVQGSLTFVSGEVAHTGSMKIGTPVATMGIRGTVGGVTTANDGTVHFYVSQSATGAVILDSHGAVIANVVQDGPMIVVRPAGPLQVIADEIQKSPAQLAIELQALQQIMSIKAIGDQYLKQALQPDQDSHPGSHHPHTQFSIDLHLNPAQDLNNGDIHNVDAPFQEPVSATVTVPNPDGSATSHDIQLPPNKPPVVFGPQPQTVAEDHSLIFSTGHHNAISVADEGVLKVTLTASHGQLTLKGFAGLTFSAGDGTGDTTMTFSGTAAAINAALDGMRFTPDHDYNGPAQIKVTATDDASHSVSDTIGINVEDDGPRAVDYNETAVAGAVVTVNLVVVLDISGSMAGERLTLAKSALANLLSETDVHINQVMAVSFSDDANVHKVAGDPWTDPVSANTYIQNLSSDGGTNYDAALAGVTDAWGNGPTAADKTLVYFISDGAPTLGQSLDATDTGAWETFLAEKHVDTSYAIGVSADVDNPQLADIAWAPGNVEFSPILLSGAGDLNDTLQGTVPTVTVHNVFTDTDAGAAFGADGGHISSITVGDDVYNYDGHGTVTHGDEPGVDAKSVSVDTAIGGHFTFYFDASQGHAAGEWTYTPPDQLTGAANEVFHYVLTDNDGDTAGANINVAVTATNYTPTVDLDSTQSSVDHETGFAASGKIAFTDADASDTHTASLQLDGTGYVGTFALDDPNNNSSHVTEANGAGSVAWHFNLTNEETNSVAAQGAATQSYDITISDNHNAAVTQTVSLSFASQEADAFHFNSETHLGADTILNFDPGTDTIVLEGYDTIAAISSNGADAAHGDAVINLGHGDSITVAGVTQDYLQQHLDQIVHLGTNV